MDINRLFDSFLGSDAARAIASTTSQAGGSVNDAVSRMPRGLAGGAVAGGIMALVLGTKKGRKYGKKAMKYGGVAALGGLAHKAYSTYSSKQEKAALADGTPITENAPINYDMANPNSQDMRLKLIQAMISAAKADGHIDAKENQAIIGQIDKMELKATEKAFIFDKLRSPSDPLSVAALAANDEQAAQLYLASLLAIDVDTAEEQRYLERLGDTLRLPIELRAELIAQVNEVS
jgi:uncharacterized membrane protein YebE (DUF533 family)